ELEFEKGHLLDRLHSRTLERIFVEERIYKRIEQKKTQEEVEKAVITGFKPFEDQLIREVTQEDVERLLKIPIRRISLFDIEKNRADIEEINAAIEKVEWNLGHLIEYALGYLGELKTMAGIENWKRSTEIGAFKKVDAREVALRDLNLRYDSEAGYLGYGLKTGNVILSVSTFDRILLIQKEGTYFVTDVPEKLFVGKGLRHCGFADKDTLENIVFTIIYQEKNLKYLFIKRCKITQYILNRTYELLPGDGYKLYTLSTLDDARITIVYKKGKGYKNLEDRTYFSRFLIKGVKASGVRLTTKEAQTLRLKHESDPQKNQQEPSLFAETDPFDDEPEEPVDD
ncbi:MAG: DNA topoisomerase IV subunit A, partial [Sphaerochaetaceae bacterium]